MLRGFAWVTALMLLGCSNGHSTPATETLDAESTTSPSAIVKTHASTLRTSPLPPLLTKLIKKQMQRHIERMETLQLATLSLNFILVEKLGRELASEPKFSRPSGVDATINQLIPSGFFDLQEKLHVSAEALATAAANRDEDALAAAYSDLATTCIRCHSIYRQIPATTDPTSPSTTGVNDNEQR